MSSRLMICAAAVLLAATGPAVAQAPSPLELVRGLREAGMADLSLEYLKDIEGKLTGLDKEAVPLERAKCLLEAAEDEPDEGTRTSMVGEAKEAFRSFLALSANHPRAFEASLALAKLTSLEAKAQLNRGRRMEVPPKDDPGYEDAIEKQRAEMLKARPLFLQASKSFSDAAAQLKPKLTDAATDPSLKGALAREIFDADLAAAINKYYLADTFLTTGSAQTLDRDKYLEEARNTFGTLAKGAATSRTVWVARAWMAEVLAEQKKTDEATAEFAAIMTSLRQEAEEGKRLVRFFQIRRAYLEALAPVNTTKLAASENELRVWLNRYGNTRRPSPEVTAARYYLAFNMQQHGLVLLGPPPADGRPQTLTQTVRTKFQDAEKLYRVVSQSDNDYTARALRNRMFVVRRLLGEADRAASTYASFEEAQMAALIQMAKLNDAERVAARSRVERPEWSYWVLVARKLEGARATAEVHDRQLRVVAFLERARELATDKDPPSDVTDNLLRLVYYYQSTEQPFQAAILGEYIARTIKTTGGKGAVAGVMALNGYLAASTRIKTTSSDPAIADTLAAAAEVSKKADRERAIQVARLLDERFPNDTATDTARHRLALMLQEEKKYDQAFDVIVKVRPGYSAMANARQLEGYLAAQLVLGEGSKATPEQKKIVFRRAVSDLGRVTRPGPGALEEEVRGYLSCRLRLAQLLLSQGRADPETEARPEARGFVVALNISNEVLAIIPTFENLLDKEKKLNLDGLNLDGAELRLQATDVRTRALYLQGQALVDGKELDAAGKAIDPVVADVRKGMLFDERMKKWAGKNGDAEGDPDADQKDKLAGLSQGIDKVRRDIVMVGFKLRCVQGNKDEAGKMLETLKLAGGGIEGNQATFERMARELAAQIRLLRKDGKAAEANALGDGLTILLKEFTNVKELSTNTILFLGQTFYTVGQYDDAVREFTKLKVPGLPPSLNLPPATAWWLVDTTKIPNDAGLERKKYQEEVRDYRFAQLNLAKAYRAAGKFPEGETLLKDAVGDPAKRGYAFGSLEYRKEYAALFEAKAATLADPKAASAEWGKARDSWTTIFGFARTSLQKALEWEAAKPNVKRLLTDVCGFQLGAVGEPASPEHIKRLKNNLFEGFFEVQRVLVAANTQLIKTPANLEASLKRIAKSIADMERAYDFAGTATKGEPVITPEVAFLYWELLEKNPILKKAYSEPEIGGKFFLEKPKVGDQNPAGG